MACKHRKGSLDVLDPCLIVILCTSRILGSRAKIIGAYPAAAAFLETACDADDESNWTSKTLRIVPTQFQHRFLFLVGKDDSISIIRVLRRTTPLRDQGRLK